MPFLGGAAADRYVELRPVGDSAFAIYSGASRTAPLRRLGEATMVPKSGFSASEPLVNIYVTNQQKVYPVDPELFFRFEQVLIPTRVERSLQYRKEGETAVQNLLLQTIPAGVFLSAVNSQGAIEPFILGANGVAVRPEPAAASQYVRVKYQGVWLEDAACRSMILRVRTSQALIGLGRGAHSKHAKPQHNPRLC